MRAIDRTIPGVLNPCGYLPFKLFAITSGSSKKLIVPALTAKVPPRSGMTTKSPPNFRECSPASLEKSFLNCHRGSSREGNPDVCGAGRLTEGNTMFAVSTVCGESMHAFRNELVLV